MKKRSSKPKLIFEKISEQIRSGNLVSGARLAPMKDLARTYGVSLQTMFFAIDLLAKEGLVDKKRGSGVYVSGELLENLESVQVKSKPRSICDDIVNSIVSGVLETGSYLPMSKSLQYQYDATFRTIREALRMVEQKGLITRKGNRYLVGQEPFAFRSTSKKIVYAVGNEAQFEILINRKFSTPFLRTFEMELNRFGTINLELVDAAGDPGVLVRLARKPETAGFLHLGIIGRKMNEENDAYREEMRILHKAECPVVYYAHAHNVSRGYVPSGPSGRQQYYVVADAYDDGRQVGTYLASIGHTRIAYFCFFSEGGPKKFLNGLEKGLRAVHGSAVKVDLHTRPVDQAWRFERDTEKDRSSLKTYLRNRFDGFDLYFPETMQELFFFEAGILTTDFFGRAMEPLFREAVQKGGSTAWVCLTEDLAAVAMRYLKKEGVRVPEQTGLVGVGNNHYSITHRITTYDSQITKQGYLAAHAMIGDIPVKRNRKGNLVCPGRMVERGSVKRL